MRKFFFISLLLTVVLAVQLYAQSSQVQQLNEALDSGNVTLTANGNGSSSGTAIRGRLRNNTAVEIRINVIITRGLYLVNSGMGQNMIAAQVFLGSMEYYMSGSTYYIRLPANSETQVVFVAYCANWDRDNPSASEAFSAAATPAGLIDISSKISRYMADNFDDDEITAVQIALWRSQGNTRAEIASHFRFDDDDWNLSTRIINY